MTNANETRPGIEILSTRDVEITNVTWRPRERRCPCGNVVSTKHGLPRCDDCRVGHRHYAPTANARYPISVVVRMPESLHQAVKDAAKAEGITMADFIRRTLRKYVDQA